MKTTEEGKRGGKKQVPQIEKSYKYVDIDPTISIITLMVNSLNIPI